MPLSAIQQAANFAAINAELNLLELLERIQNQLPLEKDRIAPIVESTTESSGRQFIRCLEDYQHATNAIAVLKDIAQFGLDDLPEGSAHALIDLTNYGVSHSVENHPIFTPIQQFVKQHAGDLIATAMQQIRAMPGTKVEKLRREQWAMREISGYDQRATGKGK